MIGFDKDFENQCEEYLEYLYHVAEMQYNDLLDIPALTIDESEALVHPAIDQMADHIMNC